MMTEYPLKVIFFGTLSLTLLISYLLRIFEYAPNIDDQGVLSYKNKNFFHISGALWYIYITFLTVGYGDLTPLTNPGRVLGIITAFLGILTTSVLIVTIQERFKIQGVEAKVSSQLNTDRDICR
jgi:hypothetical protein